MTATSTEELSALYITDETAWLEAMAELIGRKEYEELDYDNLREYLTDMANRDKKEVLSRLIVLIAHHLKWQFQAVKRTPSWRLTIAEQRRVLKKDLKAGSLRNHADAVLAEAYEAAVENASIETGLPESAFPRKSKLTAQEWLALPVPE